MYTLMNSSRVFESGKMAKKSCKISFGRVSEHPFAFSSHCRQAQSFTPHLGIYYPSFLKVQSYERKVLIEWCGGIPISITVLCIDCGKECWICIA